MQGGGQSGVAVGEAGPGEHAREDAGAGQRLVGEAAQHHLQRQRRDRDDRRPAQLPGQLPGELGVGHRGRPDQVDRPHQVVAVQHEPRGVQPVRHGDPWQPLPAAAEPPGDAQPEGQQLRLEQPAVAVQRQPDAQPHDAYARVLGRPGRGLPDPADVGQEALARRGVLLDRPVAGVAVPADRRGVQQCPRPVGFGQAGDGDRQRGGGVDPAGPDQLPVPVVPPLVAHARAGQVDDRVRLRHHRRVELRGGRVPLPLVGGARRPADQPGDLVAFRREPVDQPGAEEAGRAGHEDPHAPIFGYGRRIGCAVAGAHRTGATPPTGRPAASRRISSRRYACSSASRSRAPGCR